MINKMVADQILSDVDYGVKQNYRLKSTYELADETTKAVIDTVFIHLCGYSLKSFIEWDNEEEEDDE